MGLRKRGVMITNVTIWCGICGRPEDLGQANGTEQSIAAQKGWRNTLEDGYICAQCQKEKERQL